MLYDITINIFSDFIFAALGLLIFLYYRYSKRAKLLQFFKIDKRKRLVIYLSNLDIDFGGAIGIDSKKYSFRGSAVSYAEMKAGNRLKALFTYFLSQKDKSTLLRKLLVADIDVEVTISPTNSCEIERDTTVVCIGSPVYNQASKYIEQKWNFFAKFENFDLTLNENRDTYTNLHNSDRKNEDYIGGTVSYLESKIPPSGVDIGSGRSGNIDLEDRNITSAPQPITEFRIVIPDVQPYRDSTIGFVQRMYDHERKRCIFYVAGLSALSTEGCVYYLVKEWEMNAWKFRNENPFLVLLRISPDNPENYEIILER